jgi:flagellar P-ring protein precursor FlgI
MVPTGFYNGSYVFLNLHTPDFTTATALTNVINKNLGEGSATPVDASTVQITAPRETGQRVSFVSVLENMDVEPGVASAKVIVNSRTGTVVIGSHVKVLPAAVTHGSLTVRIQSRPDVSQPPPLSQGETVVTPNTQIGIEQEKNRMFLFDAGVSLADIVRAVNEVGAAPGDLVAILEALKEAGALRAELIVI